jgi:monoamine oxidase
MSRSMYPALHSIYGSVRSDAELEGLLAPRRQQLYADVLLPTALSAATLSLCGNLSSARVAVVGAGLAGLDAAWYLSQCGLTVTVFEATDRIGGRVRTDDDLAPGKVVEAGAELIGANHPMWWELAAIFGLQLTPLTTSEDYERAGLQVRLRMGGHDFTEAERKQLYVDLQWLIDVIGQDAMDVDPLEPWMSPKASILDGKTVSERLDELFGATSSTTRDVFEFIVENDNCAPSWQQNYLGLLALVSAGRMGDDTVGLRGYWEYTETHRCAGGNHQLAAQLATGLTDLRLSAPVDTISLSDSGVSIDWSGPSGGSEAFDYVVLAAPPFTWPTVHAAPFDWDPVRWTMSHGPAVKHLSSVDTEFWVPAGLAPSALSDGFGSLWEGTDQQPTGDGGFVLTVYSGGKYVMPDLDYPPKIAELYPGYAPSATRFVDWPATPYILTGYSVPDRGQLTTVGPNLSIPLANRMVFAGEQACPGFFGHMEGALQSGARAAKAILAAVCPNAVSGVITS